jgi:uncharacterized OB-fold protein
MSISNNRTPATAALPGMVCPACGSTAPSSANFCPNCGKRLRTTPPGTSVLKQIVVYLVSFFIAPFGLWYAWKYLKQEESKSKIIGIVAVALTLVSVSISIWAMAGLFSSISQALKSLNGLGL